MSARGQRTGGRRGGLRVRTAVGGVLAALALVVGGGAGVGAADPLDPLVPPSPAGDAAGALLGGVSGDDDPGGLVRDQGVPVPEVPPCLPPTRACVDLSTGHAWLLDGARIARGPVPITAGDREHPTPRGQFAVQWKAQDYTSREYGVAMPWSVFFAPGGIAFHEGNPETYSAGCVKLDDDDAAAFYAFLQVGDRVQVV